MQWRQVGKVVNGIKREIAINDKGEYEAIRHSSDGSNIANIVDANKDVQNSVDGFNKARDIKHVARIPAELILKWLNEDGIDVYNPNHSDRLMKKLNDPDYAYLRTGTGHMAMTQDGGFR